MNTRQRSAIIAVFIVNAVAPPFVHGAGQTDSPDNLSLYFRMIWGLCIVLGIILILFTLVKKRFNVFQARSGDAIHVLEIKPIMPKKSLCLVEVRGKEYLLGVGSEDITFLANLSDGKSRPFDEALDQARTKNT